MIIRLEISVRELFAQVADQTLYDARMAAQGEEGKHAMKNSDREVFVINLRTAVDGACAQSLGCIVHNYMDQEYVCLEVKTCQTRPETVASRLKDLLRFAMLAWWNASRNGDLHRKYADDYTRNFSSIKQQLSGACAARPYNIY